MFEYQESKNSRYLFPVLLVFLSLYLIGGCGGGSDMRDGGDGSTGRTRVVRGTINQGTAKYNSPTIYKIGSYASLMFRPVTPENALATGEEGTFIVRAVARDGSSHEVDTNPVTGDFEMELTVEECYTMSFIGHTGPEMMDEFLDFMVFDCGPEHMGIFDDQFCLSDGGEPVDLGVIMVRPDHGFASPMHDPLQDVDFDGDGVMDFHDSDYVCGNVEDNNQDGFYDDDMDHDGFHDDDMNFDGFHDGDMNHDGFHDGGDMHRDDFHHGGHMGGDMM